ncbi:MAG: hypothetical protein KJO97_00495 [Acidimicrobiia bacterium]|nr:hypothetical protein [Acidimicrobiia bacterium]
MVTTTERPTPTEIPPRPRRRYAIALAAFAVIAVAVAVTAFLGSSGTEEVAEPGPIELVQDFGEKFRAADIDGLKAMSPNGQTDERFVEWHHGLNSSPEFTECAITRDTVNGQTVRCTVQFNPDSFFARMGSPSTAASLDVSPGGKVGVVSFPPPAGLTNMSAEVRAFLEAEHPDLLDTVAGFDYSGLAFSREAGQVIDQHLDEFLAYRAANS